MNVIFINNVFVNKVLSSKILYIKQTLNYINIIIIIILFNTDTLIEINFKELIIVIRYPQRGIPFVHQLFQFILYKNTPYNFNFFNMMNLVTK